MNPQLTPRAQAVIAASDEYTDPIFRAPSVGCSGEGNPCIAEVLEECLRWHQGDPWRMGNAARRAAWDAHEKLLAAAIAATAATGEAS
jgi:hypothetical protein